MHILFLTDNFPPEVNAPASRTFEHCREWVKAGQEVTVITCAPNFPAGRVYEGYRNRLWQAETMDGIRVIRVWSYIAANEGFVKRILDYLSFMATAVLAAPFVAKVDVVVGTSPQFFTVCGAFLVSCMKKIPFVFELRDIWPESIKAVGAMGDSPLIRLLEKVELFLYRKAARIVSVTESFKRILVGRGVDGAKIAVVTNGVDLAGFGPRGKDAELTARFGLEGKFVAGYVGTHGMAHALETILDAAEQVSGGKGIGAPGNFCGGASGVTCAGASEKACGDASENPCSGAPENPCGRASGEADASLPFFFLFLGDGAKKKALMAEADRRGLRNVRFLDSVPKEEVARYWSLLDVSIIHLKKADLFTTVIPSKLFECMGMGIPVLHGVAGESAAVVEQEGVGLVFEPENAADLCEKLERLRRDADLHRRCRENCLRAARRYDRSALARAMLRHLRIARGHARGSGL